MNKESICEQCEVIFTYNAADRLGKFCSQKCHYASKKEVASCSQCHQEFMRRKKDPRKTCSDKCFMIRRGLRSKSPETREIFTHMRNEQGGQTSLLDRFFLKVRRAFELITAKLKG
jgi:hypothetical protein